MRGEYLLQLENVTKTYGYGFFGKTKFQAVDNVFLTLSNKPKILTIAGESGCGKTTLARMILGLLKPSKGSIWYKNKNINMIKPSELIWFRKEVQAIFENPYETFNPLKKVETYLDEVAKNLLGMKQGRAKRIEEVLELVGLSLTRDVRGKYPSEFSGGQMQKVSIARALLPNPSLIIADEPVSMIDTSMRMNIINTLKELKENYGVSLIYITHDLATAYYITDDITLMYRGTILEEGPANKVLVNQYHPYTKALVDSLPSHQKREKWLEEAASNPLQMEIREFLKLGCKYVAKCPHTLKKCEDERPPLFLVSGVKVACWLYEKS